MNKDLNNEPSSKPARAYSAMGKKGAAARNARERKNSARSSPPHGLTAHPSVTQSFVLLPREGAKLFAAHSGVLCPVDPVESTYVNRTVETGWLVNRTIKIESEPLANAIEHGESASPATRPP